MLWARPFALAARDMRGVRLWRNNTSYLHLMGDRYAIRHPNDLCFLTFTVVDRVDIFTRLSHRQILVDSLNFCIHNKGLVVNAWVVMSNHMHLVAHAEEGKTMSDLIRDFKRHTSNAVRGSIEDSPESRRAWLLDRMAFVAHKTQHADNYKL